MPHAPPPASRTLQWRRAMLGALLMSGACHAAGTHCTFSGGALTLNFGRLDPSHAQKVVASSTPLTLHADRAGDCAGVTFVINADDGLNFQGTRRMRSASGATIPYSLVGVPTAPQWAPGDGVYIRFSIDATVLPADYANAPAGEYRDSLLLTILP